MISFRLALLASIALSAACSPEDRRPAPELPGAPASLAATDSVGSAIAEVLRAGRNGADAPSTPMFVARTIDGGEMHPRITLAYLAGSDWCGSGGCTLLVIEIRPEGPIELGRITITDPPIRVLTSRTNGMPDLGVTVCGGGITECHEAVLPFDGRRYASNPTMPPARRSSGTSEGQVVISKDLVRLTFAAES